MFKSLNNELRENGIYIIKGNLYAREKQVIKIKVLELTEHTIYYMNLDAGNMVCSRVLKKMFDEEFTVIEHLNNFSDILDSLRNKKI